MLDFPSSDTSILETNGKGVSICPSLKKANSCRKAQFSLVEQARRLILKFFCTLGMGNFKRMGGEGGSRDGGKWQC